MYTMVSIIRKFVFNVFGIYILYYQKNVDMRQIQRLHTFMINFFKFDAKLLLFLKALFKKFFNLIEYFENIYVFPNENSTEFRQR